jgi:hypothetical protein
MTGISDVTVSYRDRNYQTQITGSGSNYSLAWSWPVVEGSDISEGGCQGL